MSINNREVSHTDVIPVIESSLFYASPETRFAIGKLAIGDKPIVGLEQEYAASWPLRVRTYYNQTGQLSAEDIHSDGTDRDVDDARSVAFGIFENRTNGQASLNAFVRLIGKGIKSEMGIYDANPLPIEEFCPELFGDSPAPESSVEVSRLIVRHEKAALQDLLRWKLYATALAYIGKHDLGPTYGVVEPWLKGHLNATIPITSIGESRYIEHYRDVNVPIEVHTEAFIDLVNEREPGLISEMQARENEMLYFGKMPSHKVVAA